MWYCHLQIKLIKIKLTLSIVYIIEFNKILYSTVSKQSVRFGGERSTKLFHMMIIANGLENLRNTSLRILMFAPNKSKLKIKKKKIKTGNRC